MSVLDPDIQYFDDSFRKKIKPLALDFLRQLNGLSVFDCIGKDQTRTRVVTTLIHGNEPSGFIACHSWLKSLSVPATNIRIIICNPEAAKKKPLFTHRYLAGDKDLNRFFSAPVTEESDIAHRARNISKVVSQVKPEAVLDLHNTSGASPAFGVGVKDNQQTLDLVSLFSNRLIYTGLNVGAIMEQDFGAPIVTIECGGANEIFSHQVATDGLNQYFSKESIFDIANNQVQVHKQPIRVELINDASVNFSHSNLPTTDITLRADIEKLNQQYTLKGEFLGWHESQQALPLKAINEEGVDQIADILEVKDGCIFTKQPLQFFMATTICEIATNDCLFYVTTKH